MFYGMPIHIIRDVALTIRSFYKRITDFVRYRQATRDMNARYPDATSDEIAREDVCIICREVMRPWTQPINTDILQVAGNAADGIATSPVDERARSKKLPCGHILHFACLRSWLERQQNCPTCRRPVLVSNLAIRGHSSNVQQLQRNQTRPGNNAQAQPVRDPVALPQVPPQNVYNFGPLRIAFGAARQGARGVAAQQANHETVPNHQGAASRSTVAVPTGNVLSGSNSQMRVLPHANPAILAAQLQQIEQQLMQEINSLRLEAEQLFHVRALQGELTRLRTLHSSPSIFTGGANRARMNPETPRTIGQTHTSEGFSADCVTNTTNIRGLTIPQGWTVLPLRRLPESSEHENREDTNAPIHSLVATPSHTINAVPRPHADDVASTVAFQETPPPQTDAEQKDIGDRGRRSTTVNAPSRSAYYDARRNTAGPSSHPPAPLNGVVSNDIDTYRKSESHDAKTLHHQGSNESSQEHSRAPEDKELDAQDVSLEGDDGHEGKGKGKRREPTIEDSVDMD